MTKPATFEQPPSFDTDSPLKRLHDRLRHEAQEQLRNEAEWRERDEADRAHPDYVEDTSLAQHDRLDPKDVN